MNNSKAGKKLNSILVEYTAPIYASDRVRYARLINWVWLQQKAGWPDEAIAQAFKLAGGNIHKVNNWWAYLTSLLPKAKGRAAEDESSKYKSEVGEIAAEFVEFLQVRRAK